MSEDNARKWVAALRSGEYSQGNGYLRFQGRHCCWGVACELSKVGYWETIGADWYVVNSARSDTGPLMEVLEWVGVGLGESYLLDSRDGNADNLMGMNDCGEFTFDQIADVIEAYLNGWNLKPGVF